MMRVHFVLSFLTLILRGSPTSSQNSAASSPNSGISNEYSKVAVKSPNQISLPGPPLKFVSPSKIWSVNVPSFVRNENDVRLRKENPTSQKISRSPEGELAELDQALSSATVKALKYLKELNVSSASHDKKEGIKSSTSYACSEDFEEEEFYIRSPNYPLNYPSFISCRYFVRRKSAEFCGVHWTILRFDLSSERPDLDPGKCRGDVVRMGGQVLCGRLGRGTEGFTLFDGPFLVVGFDSGDGFGSSGFLIKGHQTRLCRPPKPFPKSLRSSASCDRVITDRKFTLTSPSFPLDYPHNVECRYQVIQSSWDVCGILLTPSSFDVEGASYCMFDYLEVQGKRLCGNITPGEPLYYMFERTRLAIRFRTDESISSKGFNIDGKQILCSDLEYFQPIHSPLAFRKSKLDIKTDQDLHDFQDVARVLPLLVNSGVRANSLTPRRAKSFLAAVDQKPGSWRELHSSASEISSVGHPVSHSCHTLNSSRVFRVRSTDYPNPYPGNIQCSHYIEKWLPDVCQLRIILEDVDIEKATNGSDLCLSDYLDIAGYRFCGTFEKKIVNISFPGNRTAIRFNSDSKTSGRGYLITVEQVSQGCSSEDGSFHCDTTTSHESFTIFSSGYPNSYPPNLQCLTTVYKSNFNITSLEVNFKEFDVESSPDCEKDYFSVGQRRFCGHRNGNTYRIPFPGESLPLTFVTDNDGAASGFVVKIRQMPTVPLNDRGPRCGAAFYSSSFSLASPRYPQFYPPDIHCTYTVQRNSPDVCQLRFRIVLLDIAASPGCQDDYLQLGSLTKLCGKNHLNETHTFHFTNKDFNLTFHSNSEGEGTGFKLEILQKSCQPSLNDLLEEEGKEQLQEPSSVFKKIVKCSSSDCHGNGRSSRIIPKPIKNEVLENTVNSNSARVRFTRIEDDRLYYQNYVEHLLNKSTHSSEQVPSIIPEYCNWCRLYSFNRPYIINYAYSQNPSAKPLPWSSEILNKVKLSTTNYARNQDFPSRDVNQRPLKVESKWSTKNIGRDVINDASSSNLTPNYIVSPYHTPNTLNRGVGSRFNPQTVTSKTNTFSTSTNKQRSTQKNRQPSAVWGSYEEYDSLASRTVEQYPGLTGTRNSLAADTSKKPTSIENHLFLSHITPTTSSTKVAATPLLKNGLKNHKPLELQDQTTSDWAQSLGWCNQSIFLDHFKIKSPGYPGPFYADMKCLYLVHRNDTFRCGLLLEIEMLDLPGRPPCNQTFLDVAGRHFCGTEASGFRVVIPFSEKTPIRLEFRSDSFHSGAGFFLTGEQIRCSPFPLQIRGPHRVHSPRREAPATEHSSRPVLQQQRNRFPVTPTGSSFSQWQRHPFYRGQGLQAKGGPLSKPVFRTSLASLSRHPRRHVIVPWVGVSGVRSPPYKWGAENVQRLKG